MSLRTRYTALALASTMSLLLAGCWPSSTSGSSSSAQPSATSSAQAARPAAESSTTNAQPTSSTQAPSAAASPSGSQSPVVQWAAEAENVGPVNNGITPPDVASAVQGALAGYLTVSANADSTVQTDPDAWIEQMKPYSVEDFSGASRKNAPVGAAWIDAHQAGASLASRISLDQCIKDPKSTESTIYLFCLTKNVTFTDTSGNEVPADSVPDSWSIQKSNPHMQYEMVKDGDRWKVKSAEHLTDGG